MKKPPRWGRGSAWAKAGKGDPVGSREGWGGLGLAGCRVRVSRQNTVYFLGNMIVLFWRRLGRDRFGAVPLFGCCRSHPPCGAVRVGGAIP